MAIRGTPPLPQHTHTKSTKSTHAINPQFCHIYIPIATFADNLDFEVVDSTGSRDRVRGSHRGGVFVVLAMTCRSRKTPRKSADNCSYSQQNITRV